jgi:hypothetical protein
MPEGRAFEADDIYPRLRLAGIAFESPDEASSLFLPTPH